MEPWHRAPNPTLTVLRAKSSRTHANQPTRSITESGHAGIRSTSGLASCCKNSIPTPRRGKSTALVCGMCNVVCAPSTLLWADARPGIGRVVTRRTLLAIMKNTGGTGPLQPATACHKYDAPVGAGLARACGGPAAKANPPSAPRLVSPLGTSQYIMEAQSLPPARRRNPSNPVRFRHPSRIIRVCHPPPHLPSPSPPCDYLGHAQATTASPLARQCQRSP